MLLLLETIAKFSIWGFISGITGRKGAQISKEKRNIFISFHFDNSMAYGLLTFITTPQ